MKKLLIIPMLFMCSMVIGQSKKIIGKPIRIEHLEVAQNDFPKQMNWNEAKKACYALGSRWRLPTKDELNLLYTNRKKIGGFKKIGDWTVTSYYWSSTEDNNYASTEYAWRQYFEFDGEQSLGLQTSRFNVRAVRAF